MSPSIHCPRHGGNEHPDASCIDPETDRFLCDNGVAFCQVHLESEELPAVMVDPASGLRLCAACRDEVAETEGRTEKWDELQRTWLVAGSVIRAEREGRVA